VFQQVHHFGIEQGPHQQIFYLYILTLHTDTSLYAFSFFQNVKSCSFLGLTLVFHKEYSTPRHNAATQGKYQGKQKTKHFCS